MYSARRTRWVATKKDVLEIIEQLPDDATVDDIMYELYFCSASSAG
jgi:hypothetical protein